MVTRRWFLGAVMLAGLVALAVPAPSRRSAPVAAGAAHSWGAPAAAPPLSCRVLVWRPVMIGFIGDSITRLVPPGTRQSPADAAAAVLGPRFGALNCAQPGWPTASWLPKNPNHALQQALGRFRAANVAVVHVMLGNNDARSDLHVAPALYAGHVRAILTALAGAGFRVVVSYPPAVKGGALTGPHTLALLRAYEPQIDRLVDGRTVLQGDRRAFRYFAAHAAQIRPDQVHPTAQGVLVYGRLWAPPLRRALALAGVRTGAPAPRRHQTPARARFRRP